MEIKQIATLVNSITAELLGGETIIEEDLSNVVDVGTAIFNATDVDHYAKALVNHIGKVVFVNRPYSGSVPSVLMDSWEFGSVMEKINVALPDATENESWELEDGASYDENIFYKPTVDAKFYNKRVTFEVPMSFTDKQVKESFSSATQLNGFISMLYNAIDKSMTVKVDELVMRTINNMIGETLYADFPSGDYGDSSGVKAVNLLYLYNEKYSESLNADSALTDPDFIRFASYMMGVYTARLAKLSNLFNIGGKDRFTPSDLLHVVMLADFKKSADVFLQSGTFNDEYTALPNAELVPLWQNAGDAYDFDDITAIKIRTASGQSIDATGILAVMFDRDALGVCNIDRRTTTKYNAKAEFTNTWTKFDAGYFNDTNENFVVFYVADESTT